MAIDSICYKVLCNENVRNGKVIAVTWKSHTNTPLVGERVTLPHCTHTEGACSAATGMQREPIRNRLYTWFYQIFSYINCMYAYVT